VIPPSGKCVWGCESGQPLNKEHIIAKKVADAMGLDYPIRLSWGDIHRSTGEEIERGERVERKGLEIVLADRVCERCNKRWMSKLDDRMLRFMRPTLETEAPVQLDPPKRLTLARWATKVGLLLALWLHDQPLADPDTENLGESYAPARNFTVLYGHSTQVPDHTQVWMGAMDPSIDVSESGVFIAASAIYAGPRPVGYYVLLSLRRLVFLVIGTDIAYGTPHADDWAKPKRGITESRAMIRIWPCGDCTVAWPPPAYLEPDGLADPVELKPD
jgi:hypothetical protein